MTLGQKPANPEAWRALRTGMDLGAMNGPEGRQRALATYTPLGAYM